MSEKEIKTRRFYLVLPFLVLPFVTVAFWLMGGGVAASGNITKSGLNMSLPDARVAKDSARDKLSFYEMANADSAKREEQLRNDPNTHPKQMAEAIEVREMPDTRIRLPQKMRMPLQRESSVLPAEEYIPTQPQQITKREVDPDIEAINQTLEKLAALQHPAKSGEKVVSEEQRQVLQVGALAGDDESYFGKKQLLAERKQFLNEKASGAKSAASFAAFVPVEQTLQNGSVIKLRLKQAITVNGEIIPSGASVHGVVTLENERVFAQISSIQYGGYVYPVSLSVFDMDGIEGIHVPGSVARDVMKSAAEQSLQSVNVLSLDPSIKTQALTAGVGLAKNLLTRKVKIVRATVTAGYSVLLRDNKLY